ncbi:hypothetical protein EDC04DRAFT_2902008 [Pisolithus marmoratus]|nr:hypothetical protein EDC04DRAFT_2902008 [Pisolithus marmoratus]
MVITFGKVDQGLHKQAEDQAAHASASLSQGAHSSALQITTNASQGAHSSALQVNTNISQGAHSSSLPNITNASQLAPGIEDETMKSPSVLSNQDATMGSPLVGSEPPGQNNELTMASPNALSPRSPMLMEGSSLMSLMHPPPSTPQPAAQPIGTQVHQETIMADVRTGPHFIHHPYLDSLNLVVNAEFGCLVCQLSEEGIAATSA